MQTDNWRGVRSFMVRVYLQGLESGFRFEGLELGFSLQFV